MSPPNITYSIWLLIAGTACLLVAAVILQTRRSAKGATALMVLLFALAWWDVTYSVFWANVPGPTKYFWLDITYVGAVTVPAAVFVFSLQITNLGKWLERPLAIFIYTEPILVLVCLFTDSLHGLFFAGKRVANSAVILDAGPVFWFNVVYSYALILWATILLIRFYTRSSGIYRKQIGVVLIGISITWLNSIVFVAGLSPLKGADNTPFSFTIAAIAFAFALWRYQLLDIVPIARDLLIEKMADGVLVVDSRRRIVDMNPKVQSLLGISSTLLGRPVEEAFSSHLHEKNILSFVKPQIEIELSGKTKKYVDMQTTPIMDDNGKNQGVLIILHDITKLKHAQHELRLIAIKDSLTGATSRGHFMELAREEIHRTKRLKRPLSLVLMDMDGFKKVNDTYGHESGDSALVALKNISSQCTRKTDIFARLGGEEFVLLLPETEQKAAFEVAEKLRRTLEKTTIKANAKKFKTTISMGVTEFGVHENDTLETMLHDQIDYVSSRK
ncbi:MAG: histidine kinase N-terminal 7TM domain-containing protein [Anaerolineales bacterium]